MALVFTDNKTTLDITAECLAAGIRASSDNCPLAIAAKNAGVRCPYVRFNNSELVLGRYLKGTFDIEWLAHTFDPELCERLDSWDQGGSLFPFTVALTKYAPEP